MKNWKGIFLLFVFALSVGFSTSVEAGPFGRSRGRSRDSSRNSGRSNNKEKNDSLKDSGKTTGIGREIGGAIGGHFGGMAGEHLGRNIGDKLEKNGNRHAHDKWNKRDKNSTSWRFSLDEEYNEEY